MLRLTEALIKIDDLVKTAKVTGSKESIATLYQEKDYKIGVGVRIRKEEKVDVFTAASISLGFSDDCSVDLEQLTETVVLLRKLRDIGYCLCYIGHGWVYAERATRKKDAKQHVEELLKLLAKDTH